MVSVLVLPVFNGGGSKLYVDGVSESGVKTNVGTGFLDGLTLGTDHRNDFPLGSTSEGPLLTYSCALTRLPHTRHRLHCWCNGRSDSVRQRA